MRRLIVEEPVSRAALWSLRIAWFALAVTLIAVLLLRFQRVDLIPGAAALVAGLASALGAVLLAVIAFVQVWREGRRGLGSAIVGLGLASLILAWPAFLAFRAATLPAITDVTTDVEDPPAFSRSRAAYGAREGRLPSDPSPQARSQQRTAYARIASLTLDVSAEDAFELVRRAAARRGWTIIEASRPGGRSGAGRLDAVDKTLLLRLPEDITVRVRPLPDGARVDVRSASRIGYHDFGTNAARIQAFLDEVSNLALAM